jgi:hypothetical protein
VLSQPLSTSQLASPLSGSASPLCSTSAVSHWTAALPAAWVSIASSTLPPVWLKIQV